MRLRTHCATGGSRGIEARGRRPVPSVCEVRDEHPERRGRPPLPAVEAKSERVTIALRADQYAALKAWVEKQPETRPFKPTDCLRSDSCGHHRARGVAVMRVMPANASGWFWHSLARETGRLGHLYSPKGQRGPWPWISLRARQRRLQLLGPKTNTFDTNKWASMERQWHQLIVWAQAAPLKPLWAIVPDVPATPPARSTGGRSTPPPSETFRPPRSAGRYGGRRRQGARPPAASHRGGRND